MIKLTYIFHSGFVAETATSIMIFDYWTDPSGIVRHIMSSNHGKHVYVFSSHFHEDHFTKDILLWKGQYAETTFTYILSKDILKHRRTTKEKADVWIVKGGRWKDENINVIAAGSNDSGVSWIIETEGMRIFHAGDLCNWYARFLSDDNITDTIFSEEFGEICPKAEEKRFLGELKDIRKITDSFDIAMFPVDGRIGNGYTLGARQFIDRFHIGLFTPMHFVMSGFESAWRMEAFCKKKNISFWKIGHDGASIFVHNGFIVRKTIVSELAELMDIFSSARNFMAANGNPHQWTTNYPNREIVTKDIEEGCSYIIEHNGKTVATFVLRPGVEPAYETIEDGQWLNNEPYLTIHRVASNGLTKGIFHLVVMTALSIHNNIRIDTHRDNAIMQKSIIREGFRHCGTVCYSGSGERIAYQLFAG